MVPPCARPYLVDAVVIVGVGDVGGGGDIEETIRFARQATHT